MRSPDDYTYVAAWGRMLGSSSSFIRDQMELAAQEDAPLDAIHRRDDGTWSTTDDISKMSTRLRLGLPPRPPQEPKLSLVALELRRAILWTEFFHDMFGMTQVEQFGDSRLSIRFATGWSVQVDLMLQPPEPDQ